MLMPTITKTKSLKNNAKLQLDSTKSEVKMCLIDQSNTKEFWMAGSIV